MVSSTFMLSLSGIPFGLSAAYYAFTKLMCPLIRYWKGRGLRVALHMDDGKVAVKGKEKAMQQSERVQSELLEAGLIINNTKSHLVPKKSLIWLGFQINLQDGQLTIPDQKVESLTMLMQQVKNSTGCWAFANRVTYRLTETSPDNCFKDINIFISYIILSSYIFYCDYVIDCIGLLHYKIGYKGLKLVSSWF